MTAKAKKKPLWRCPKCGERFVTAHIWHACGRYTLDDLFAGCEPHVLKLFRRFAGMVKRAGPVRVIPQKSRVVFQVRVRFGGSEPRKSYLLCNLALPRRVQHSRLFRIESYSAHFHKHWFRVRSEQDLDATVRGWIRQAYKVGAQEFVEGKKVKGKK